MFAYTAPPLCLKDKVILVTGAGDGIGKAAAKAYAQAGATVILLGRSLDKLEATYDEIEAEGHPQPALVPMNLESAGEHEYNELAQTLINEFGRLDGLLHNAGILGLRTALSDYDPSTWQQVMQINVNAPFLLTQALMPLLEAAPHASVVFTSSGVGKKGRAYWGAYAVSKFATEGLMETLADELDNTSNVRANAINPGATRTQMRATAYPAEDPFTLPTPEDILPVYLYLMSDDSIGTNGKSLDAQG
ncbi:MAG: YciK family oxidoreductase [Pontibacterium sp.]